MPRRSRRALKPAPVRFSDSCRFTMAPSGEVFTDYGRALAALAGSASPASLVVRSPFGNELPVPTDAHAAEVAARCWEEMALAVARGIDGIAVAMDAAVAANRTAEASGRHEFAPASTEVLVLGGP